MSKEEYEIFDKAIDKASDAIIYSFDHNFEEVKIGSHSTGYVNGIFPNFVNVAVIKKNGDIFVGEEAEKRRNHR